MAIRALIERNPHILWFSVRPVRVTFSALHLNMQTGQWVPCFGVIELSDVDGFPVLEVMALLAVRAEASFVLIFMTGDTSRRQAKIRAVQILDLNRLALKRRSVRWIVTFVAVEYGVLTLEHISGFLVIEGPYIPLDQRKIFSIVFGVAARTLLTGTCGDVIGGVETLVSRETACNLSVTLQTLQLSLSTELMATGAVGGSIQRSVWPRERPRRDLRRG